MLPALFFFTFNKDGYCRENLISPSFDWRAQGYNTCQAISSVQYNRTGEFLSLACNFNGKDSSLSNGEVVLDLDYVPYVQPFSPVDMTGREIEAQLEIPQEFAGSLSNPNGCQFFVKDDRFFSQYGPCTPITKSGLVTIKLKPGYDSSLSGYTSDDFNPARIRTIGIRILINPSSNMKFNCEIIIRSITVSPSLPRIERPPLPESFPVPFLKGTSNVTLNGNSFYADNTKWFITGGNWFVLNYRQNFGATAWAPGGNGVSFHQSFVSERLELFRQAGITLVRVGLLDDGAALMDKDCNVTGYNDIFRNDVRTFLDLAVQYNMKVEFTLVDFLIAGKAQDINGVWVRGRRDIIESSAERQHFIESFLVPFLSEFGQHPALFGFDLMNEPEWIIDKKYGGAWRSKPEDMNVPEKPLSYSAFVEFVSECSVEIRRLAPGKFITLGVSCKYLDLAKNKSLDYGSRHYYEWMGSLNKNLNRVSGYPAWMLEEFPGKGDLITYFSAAYNAGAAGALLWNLTPDSDQQCYKSEEESRKLLEIRHFVDSFDESMCLQPVEKEKWSDNSKPNRL